MTPTTKKHLRHIEQRGPGKSAKGFIFPTLREGVQTEIEVRSHMGSFIAAYTHPLPCAREVRVFEHFSQDFRALLAEGMIIP